MVALNRVRAIWSGFSGGPGVSTFYVLDPSVLTGPFHNMFEAMASSLPDDVTITIQPFGDKIESTTGTLVGQWTGAGQLAVLGQSAAGYAAPVGMLQRWETDTIADGRRLRGKSYWVPVAQTSYETNGTLAEGPRSGLESVGTALIQQMTGNLVVWHRPRAFVPATATKPAQLARAGSHGVVTACSVPDKAVVLRSRRD